MVITTKTKKLNKVKGLYLSAFPKHERLPYFLLKISSLLKGVKFTEYYDNDLFCGFTFTVETDYTLYVFYFAIPENLRGKGYGTAILTHIKNAYPNKTVTLNIEPLTENCDNYLERVNRFNFYKRNGFYDSGYTVYDVGGGFTVLYTKTNVINGTEFTFEPNKYIEVYKKLTLGLWKVKIEKNAL
ncbi:MAG: GNAT family N-acetyltransferase [Clostridia bacterium]|nr:GNAT family N-acetyltransferase [Clostridia bacterium]